MKVDIDHVLFWMDAIRNSSNKYRTLESFWKGQVHSKIWLIEKLKPFIDFQKNNDIVIHGGWNGVLASLLFQSDIPINQIISIDLDPECHETANTVNKIEEISGKFKSVTANMSDYFYENIPDIVVNTSCEHISQETYIKWLNNIPNNSLIVLQSNNYEIPEHIRIAESENDFINQSNLNVLFSSTLKLQKYDRYLIIGKKIV
jgi:hypothetical protein